MAATLSMPIRPVVDRTASFESCHSHHRARSPHAQSSHPSSPYEYVPPAFPHPHHSRHSSASSSPPPHATPYAHQQAYPASSYFPQHYAAASAPGLYGHQPPQAWTTAPLPATSFYSQPFPGTAAAYANQPVFHPGFQQSQADFAAWAGAYHNMYMASMAAGAAGGAGVASHSGHVQGHMTPPARQDGIEYLGNDNGSGNPSGDYDARSNTSTQSGHQRQQSQPYHPYKRGPTSRPSREKVGQMPRSTSQPSLSGHSQARINGQSGHSPAGSITAAAARASAEGHRRASSMDSKPVGHLTHGPHGGFTPSLSRVDSVSHSARERENMPPPEMQAQTVDRASPVSSSTIRASSPLQPGPIASQATNNSSPSVQTSAPTAAVGVVKPHPLSQLHASAPSPDPTEKKSSGLRGKLKGAFGGGKSDIKKGSTAPTVVSSPSITAIAQVAAPTHPSPPPSARTAQSAVFTSPSETSTRIATPPATPSQTSQAPDTPPKNGNGTTRPLPTSASAFRVMQPAGLGSDVSLANTEATAQAPSEILGLREKEKKRSLFRMKNMSTDNISLSSTVSSASMMIRKMGNIGKLAKRNSLAGISKIFKDRNRDDDDVLPQVEGKKKGDKKLKKGKGAVASAAVSHATVESERPSLSMGEGTGEEDRALAGLSPAAKLARQHTLKSKAEAEMRDQDGGAGGVGARPMPSLGSVSSGLADSLGPPDILHVRPRTAPSVVRATAVAVNPDQEYDSNDDSSDGETVDVEPAPGSGPGAAGAGGVADMTARLGRTRISDVPTMSSVGSIGSLGTSEAADAEFRDTWGHVWIDRGAVPKKGILKRGASLEGMNAQTAARAAQERALAQSSGSGQDRGMGRGGLPVLTGDGGSGASTPSIETYGDDALELEAARRDPFSVHFSPFDATPPVAPFSPHFDINASTNGKANTNPAAMYTHPSGNTSAPTVASPPKPVNMRSMTVPARRRINWAPECAVYSTYDAGTYDRRSEPSTCNRLTPELALAIKQELNAFKLEMPVHPASMSNTHYFQ